MADTPPSLRGSPVVLRPASDLRPPQIAISGVTKATASSDAVVAVAISDHDASGTSIMLQVPPFVTDYVAPDATTASLTVKGRRVVDGGQVVVQASTLAGGDMSVPAVATYTYNSAFPPPGTNEPIAVTIDPDEGSVGTVFSAVVTGDPLGTIARTWKLDGVTKSTAETYAPDEAGDVTVTVVVSSPDGTADPVTSAAVTVTAASELLELRENPAFTVDAAAVGGVLTVTSIGDPAGDPTTVKMSIRRNGEPIVGYDGITAALGPAYTFVTDDAGQEIDLYVIAERDGLYADGYSDPINIAAADEAPYVISPPEIAGPGTVGSELLEVSEGEFGGYPGPDDDGWTTEGWWQRNGADIPGANDTTYTIADDDQGATIRRRRTVSNGVGNPVTAYSGGISVPAAQGDIVFITKNSSNGTNQNIPASEPGQTAFAIVSRVGSNTMPSVPTDVTDAWIAPTGSANVDPSHSDVCAGLVVYKRPTVSNENSGAFADAQRIVLPLYSGVRSPNPIIAMKWASGTGTSINIPALTYNSSTAHVIAFWTHQGTTPAIAPNGWGEGGVMEPREHGNNRATYDSDGPMASFAGATAQIETAGNWLACAFAIERSGVGGGDPTPEPGDAPELVTSPAIDGGNTVGSVLTRTNGIYTGDAPVTVTGNWRADGVNISGATGVNYTVASGDQEKIITWFETASNAHGSASAGSNGILIPLSEPDDPGDPEPEAPAALTLAQWSVYGVAPDPAVPNDPRRAAIIAVPSDSPAFASDNVRWQVAGAPTETFARAMTLLTTVGPNGEKLWRTTSNVPASDPDCPHLRAQGSSFSGFRLFYTIDDVRSHPSEDARNIPVPVEPVDPGDPGDPPPVDDEYEGWNVVNVTPSNYLSRFAQSRSGRTVYRAAAGVYNDFYWPSNVTDYEIALVPQNRHNPPTFRSIRFGPPGNLNKGNYRHLVNAAKGTNFTKKITVDGINVVAVKFTSYAGVSTISGDHKMPDAATKGGIGWRVYRVTPSHPSGNLVGGGENGGYYGLGFRTQGPVEVKNCLFDGYSIGIEWYPKNSNASGDIHHNDFLDMCEDIIKFDTGNLVVRDNHASGRPPTEGIANASGGPPRPHGDFLQGMRDWTGLKILRNAIIDPSGHLAGGQIRSGPSPNPCSHLLMEGNELRSSANTAWWCTGYTRVGSGVDGTGYDVIIRGNKHWQYPGVPWLQGNPSTWRMGSFGNARVLITNNVAARMHIDGSHSGNTQVNNGSRWPSGWKEIARDRVGPGQPFSGRYGATAGVIPG